MTQTAETREKANRFRCERCGGTMTFDPPTQTLHCDFCDFSQTIDIVMGQAQEHALSDAPRPEQMDWGDSVRVVKCASCGATTALEANASATFCAFCGASHVLEDPQSAGIAPEQVLPFQITAQQAKDAFRKWMKKRFFAPSAAKKNAMLGRITGVYLPYWTYDADAIAHYQGEAGYHYYVTVTRTVTRDGKQVQEQVQEQRTRWEPASGVVRHVFDDTLVAASQRLDPSLLEGLQPFDLDKLAAYRPAFLSGYLSELPALSVDEGWEKAQETMNATLESDARDDILSHADEARVSEIESRFHDVTYKLTLLPVWISSYVFQSKTHHVAVNGQTGRVQGTAPVSGWRVAGVVAAAIAVIVLLVLLLGQ